MTTPRRRPRRSPPRRRPRPVYVPDAEVARRSAALSSSSSNERVRGERGQPEPELPPVPRSPSPSPSSSSSDSEEEEPLPDITTPAPRTAPSEASSAPDLNAICSDDDMDDESDILVAEPAPDVLAGANQLRADWRYALAYVRARREAVDSYYRVSERKKLFDDIERLRQGFADKAQVRCMSKLTPRERLAVCLNERDRLREERLGNKRLQPEVIEIS